VAVTAADETHLKTLYRLGLGRPDEARRAGKGASFSIDGVLALLASLGLCLGV